MESKNNGILAHGSRGKVPSITEVFETPEDELVIDDSNFEEYFFDVRTNKPKPGQVLACYDAIAEFIDGNLKQDIIQLLLQNNRAGETAPRLMQKLAGATVETSMSVVKEMLNDMIAGMPPSEVARKPYEFHCQHFYYTQKEYLPDNDPHWWSSCLIDVRTLDSSEVSEKLRSE